MRAKLTAERVRRGFALVNDHLYFIQNRKHPGVICDHLAGSGVGRHNKSLVTFFGILGRA